MALKSKVTPAMSDVVNLQSSLNAKADMSNVHDRTHMDDELALKDTQSDLLSVDVG